jgi:hypothetical protein
VVAVGNAFCAFSKELVDAFLASTAPAASTARVAAERDGWTNEIGCLAGSAWMPLRWSAAGGFAPRPRLSVRSLQWGVAP